MENNDELTEIQKISPVLTFEIAHHPAVMELREAAAKALGHLSGLLLCEPESMHTPMRQAIYRQLELALGRFWNARY